MRDRLIELVVQAREECTSTSCFQCGYRDKEMPKDCVPRLIADHLLANGVVVPPCKVGTVVYRVCKQKYPVDSYRMHWEEDWVILTRPFDLSMIPEIGKTVFLTREEAEQALKGREDAHE